MLVKNCTGQLFRTWVCSFKKKFVLGLFNFFFFLHESLQTLGAFISATIQFKKMLSPILQDIRVYLQTTYGLTMTFEVVSGIFLTFKERLW